MSKLAPSVFTGVADDALVALDIYGTKTAEVKNEFLSTVNSFASKFTSMLGSQKSLLSSITREVLAGNPFDRKTALQRLENVVRGSRGLMDGLTTTLQNDVLNAVGLDSLDAKSLTVTIGSVVRQISNGSATNALGITRILNTMGNTKGLMSIIDTSAEASMMGDLYGEVIKWRVPEATDLLMNGASTSARNSFLTRLAGQIGNEADQGSIKNILDKGKDAAGSLLAGAPDFAHRMVSNLKLDKVVTPDLYQEHLSILKSNLTTLQPNWAEGARKSVAVASLGIFKDASDDAMKLLLSDPDHRDTAMIAGVYYDTTLPPAPGTRRKFTATIY